MIIWRKYICNICYKWPKKLSQKIWRTTLDNVEAWRRPGAICQLLMVASAGKMIFLIFDDFFSGAICQLLMVIKSWRGVGSWLALDTWTGWGKNWDCCLCPPHLVMITVMMIRGKVKNKLNKSWTELKLLLKKLREKVSEGWWWLSWIW